MRLIIIGSMASGKSTVGRKLSKKLGLNFFDIDNEIEKKAGAKIVSGLDMFIQQGLASINIWEDNNISQRVNVNNVKKVLEEKLC